MELDLSIVKYAFLDFDDTLCVWTEHDKDHERWFKYMFREDPSYFAERKCYPLPGMDEMLRELNGNGVVCYGLSWMEYSFIAEAKTKWVHSVYGKSAVRYVIGTSSREGKIEFLKDFCTLGMVNRKEILLVEGHPITLNEARDEGFQIMSAAEVTVRYVNTMARYENNNN